MADSEEGPAESVEGNEEPRFVDRFLPINPDKVQRHQFRYIDHRDIDTEEDIELLLKLLYEQPEISNYIFHQDGSSLNEHLLALTKFNIIRIEETEANWFRHPKFPGDFVRIRKDPPFEWEKDVRGNEPMYWRSTIGLTEHERRKREHAELAAAVSSAITPQPPRTLLGHIEHNYRNHQALYWAMAVGISLLLALIFAS